MRIVFSLALSVALLTGQDTPKLYESVITKDAVSKPGIFTAHQVKDKLYYEIPSNQFGKEFLWIGRLARTISGVSIRNIPVSRHTVRWERRGNTILLKTMRFNAVAEPSQPIARGVEAVNSPTIVASFPIEAVGSGDAPVIDVTKLFTTEIPEFSARFFLGARGFDSSRSYIERVAAFSRNINVEAFQTYTLPSDSPEPTRNQDGSLSGMRPGSATVAVVHSMVALPENPMRPRYADDRVSYMGTDYMDYSSDTGPQKRRYIFRWRLEKKDPNAAVSEAVKPIQIWIDWTTPLKWRPYVRRGIEAWRGALEEAGFRNAIVARQAPTPEEDPAWSAEDARYTVMTWQAAPGPTAFAAPHADPRTGEILTVTLQFFHGILTRMSGNYFVQASPLDPRARTFPLPDEVVGSLVEYVVAHEVGHALGLPHNMKASAMYPADKVRDREWVKKMGHSPSILDYARFNYVAQPEDNLDPADLVPKVGPWDRWAVIWGYKPIPEARTPEEELPILDRWAREQDRTPWLRSDTVGAHESDPSELVESVGDADAIQSSALGLKNLHRVMEMLLPATTRQGKNWDLLEEVYGRVVGQWTNEMMHVAAIVGGVESRQLHGGQTGPRFQPVSKERQQAAMRFLNENAFPTPNFLLDPNVLGRIEPSGGLGRISEAHTWILSGLLGETRLVRLLEHRVYPPEEFFADLRRGVWAELYGPSRPVDPYRAALQRAYLELMAERLHHSAAIRAYARGELSTLDGDIGSALANAQLDRPTRFHLEDARQQIANALDPKFPPPAPRARPEAPSFPLRFDSGICTVERR
ncbi:MAG: zinc-dependent metalloprotease [Bryobacteraceae bacterium]